MVLAMLCSRGVVCTSLAWLRFRHFATFLQTKINKQLWIRWQTSIGCLFCGTALHVKYWLSSPEVTSIGEHSVCAGHCLLMTFVPFEKTVWQRIRAIRAALKTLAPRKQTKKQTPEISNNDWWLQHGSQAWKLGLLVERTNVTCTLLLFGRLPDCTELLQSMVHRGGGFPTGY